MPPTPTSDITGLLIVVLVISVIPFIAMVVTSYMKIVVVLGLLRNALGVQQVPPNMVLNGIAIIVSTYIMAPVAFSAMQGMQSNPQGNGNVTQNVTSGIAAAREPFRVFLEAHAHSRERQFFLRSATALWPAQQAKSLKDTDLIVLAPAFTLTELTEAFKIGFLLYIAFIVVDLVIANILMAMGLNQVQPTNVAIPFKLLLFVAMDGWSTLMHGLILGYR
ncbi:type III secretion system export apparatus subunit SctR [Burkholderia metallica]|uniref:type III secretion system export apparatus subunit SctR n=1 Tax=Burkholderia metallica TaxID=488729 RepID=UPI001CF5FA85|nr:type III secretion system export apparatus subunit SctR [Burkholderia metallica]MCA8002731.1 type III secretion system export apparatus subunit SctR [Burkholderia metallica]